jgi:hypothetical protein
MTEAVAADEEVAAQETDVVPFGYSPRSVGHGEEWDGRGTCDTMGPWEVRSVSLARSTRIIIIVVEPSTLSFRSAAAFFFLNVKCFY